MSLLFQPIKSITVPELKGKAFRKVSILAVLEHLRRIPGRAYIKGAKNIPLQA